MVVTCGIRVLAPQWYEEKDLILTVGSADCCGTQ